MTQIILETDEQIKRRKKGMGSKKHSWLQYLLILELSIRYKRKFKLIPELSLDLNGVEKIPDISVYEEFDVSADEDEIRVKDLPLGVIEILSPSQAVQDLVLKANEYFDAGIGSYWLVLPSLRSIYVYSQKGECEVYTQKDILKDKKLGIELDLSTIF